MKQLLWIPIALVSFSLVGCGLSRSVARCDQITQIHLTDHSGMSETVSEEGRLASYESVDFLAPQPYQKVQRVYGRDAHGNTPSTITSYHPNGQIKQFLEVVNHRAYGSYREWYANGQLKVESQVVGGIPDLNTAAEASWLFDGLSRAWNSDGELVALINYDKGELDGESLYFHSNGELWKRIPYSLGSIHGTCETYLEGGHLFLTCQYHDGVREGPSVRYWSEDRIAYREIYQSGKLETGDYFLPDGEQISEIRRGHGHRALFGREGLVELREYKGGIQEGQIQIFSDNQELLQTYSTLHHEKQGVEVYYYPTSGQDANPKPKLLLTWHEGVLQGPMKTWYPNGTLESAREMCQNQKSGVSTAWYENGALMFVEEYENDLLVKGEYFRLGEQNPISEVSKGGGIATLFQPSGHPLRKISYHEGRPEE